MKFNNQHVCKIKVKGFKKEHVTNVILNIRQMASILNLQPSGLTPLPKKIKKFTVLSSPHVNKKSREQFEIRQFTKIIVIKVDSLKLGTLKVLLDYLKKYTPLSITLEITRYTNVILK